MSFRQCFLHQPGRRFVFGLILSSDSFQLVYFDRSGAVECMPVDIHADAAQLVQVIRLLGDPNLSRLGLDPSIYWEIGGQHVDIRGIRPGSRKRVLSKYEIERVHYQLRPLVQEGTTIWTVKEVASGERVLVKRIWHAGESNEGRLLSVAKQKGVEGVGNLHFVEKTSLPLLSISSLRTDQCFHSIGHVERWFSQIVIAEFPGPSIAHFESGLQLVQALHDVIAGVLHLSSSISSCSF